MPTFAQGLEKAVNVIKSVVNMPANWKRLQCYWSYHWYCLFVSKLEEKGADIFVDSIDQLSDQVLKAAENFLLKEFPAMMAKLYGKLLLSCFRLCWFCCCRCLCCECN